MSLFTILWIAFIVVFVLALVAAYVYAKKHNESLATLIKGHLDISSWLGELKTSIEDEFAKLKAEVEGTKTQVSDVSTKLSGDLSTTLDVATLSANAQASLNTQVATIVAAFQESLNSTLADLQKASAAALQNVQLTTQSSLATFQSQISQAKADALTTMATAAASVTAAATTVDTGTVLQVNTGTSPDTASDLALNPGTATTAPVVDAPATAATEQTVVNDAVTN